MKMRLVLIGPPAARTEGEPPPETDEVTVAMHVLPDGHRVVPRFIRLEDGRVGAVPDRLYVVVNCADGRVITIDGMTTDTGTVDLLSVTVARPEGGLDVPTDVGAGVRARWVESALNVATASLSGGGPLEIDYGPEGPEVDDSVRREIMRRQRRRKRPGRPSQATPELLARVARYHAAGMTQQEIAEAVGKPRSTVGRWLRDLRDQGRLP